MCYRWVVSRCDTHEFFNSSTLATPTAKFPRTCTVVLASESLASARQAWVMISRLSATISVEHNDPPTVVTKRSMRG